MSRWLPFLTLGLLLVGCSRDATPLAAPRKELQTMLTSRTITVSIARSPRDVAAFVTNPANLTAWLTFVTSVRQVGGEWVMETAGGPMTIRFVEPNEQGILDHYVRLPSGTEVLNPMRVIPNGLGSEVLFTLFRLPEMTESQFAEDAATVEKDLTTLRHALENEPSASR